MGVQKQTMQQITPTLFIGDMQDAMAATSSNFDVLIYLGQEIPMQLCFNCEPVCLHFPLIDGANGLTKIRHTVLLAYITLLSGNKTLVACRAGISRSVCLTASMYALSQRISFDEAYKHVKHVRPQAQPELNLLNEFRKTTGEVLCCI